jgi:hypothetical protein
MGLRGDYVKGVFLNMAAGHHIAGAVALSAAVYLFYAGSKHSVAFRASASLLLAAVVILSDAKQVLAAFLAGLLLMILLNITKSQKLALYIALTGVVIGLLVWAASTIFPALAVWVTTERLMVGFRQKFSIFPLTVSYYETFFNWLFGLAPGHTVGRLAWLAPKYAGTLERLGITISPFTLIVWDLQNGHWVSNPKTGSSMFSLLFSWSGVWGDLGLLGSLFVCLVFCLEGILPR